MNVANFLVLLVYATITGAAVNTSDPCGDGYYIHGPGLEIGAVNLTFSTQEDATIANACTHIYPNVLIDKSFPGVFNLPALEKMWGSIYVGKLEDRPTISPSALTGLSFPKLKEAGSIEIFGAAGITSLDFPELVTIRGLFLDDLPKLGDLGQFSSLFNISTVEIANTGISKFEWGKTFPHISSPSGSYPPGRGVSIGNNTNLQEINLENLKTVPILQVWANGNTSLYAGIQHTGEVEISGIASWLPGFGFDGFGFPHLNQSDSFDSMTVNFHDNNLTSIVMNGIKTVDDLKISGNPKLQFFSFPDLDDIYGDLDVTNNHVLKVINVTSLGNNTKMSRYGAINFTGVFTDLSWPPPQYGPSSVTILATGNASCVLYDVAYRQHDPYIPYNCTSDGTHQPITLDPPSGSSTSANSSNSLDSATLAEIIAPIVSFVVWVCITWWWCVRHRRHRRERKAMAAQLATIAAAFLPPQQQGPANAQPKGNVPDRRLDDGKFEKPELGVETTVVRDLEVEVMSREGEERERNAELEHAPMSRPVEMNAPGLFVGELDGGSRLSRAEELEARERALAAREDAAIKAREEALVAREREVEELERQNTFRSHITPDQ